VRLLALLVALAAAALGAGCAGGPRLDERDPAAAGLSEAAAAEVLARFCRALEAGRFEEAHALLAARWKAAYTPGRLALDRAGAGPAGAEASARVLAALGAGVPVVREGDRAVLPVDAGRAAEVVAEEGGWRVTALE
jgi:hypothetical protein